MMIRVYGLKNCDSCKRVMAQVKERNVPFDFIDIRDEADLRALLPGWLDQIGVKTLVNVRSTTWRNMDEGRRQNAKAGDIEVLADNPTLIKRPIVVVEGRSSVGLPSDF